MIRPMMREVVIAAAMPYTVPLAPEEISGRRKPRARAATRSSFDIYAPIWVI